MKNKKNIYDLIKNLSPEEIKLHNEIIEECMERESRIDSCSEVMKNNFKKLDAITEDIASNLEKILSVSRSINDKARTLSNKTASVDLSQIPDEKFYSA